MSTLRTTADIKKGVLRRCGEFTDGTSQYEEATIRYINQMHRSIIAGANEFNVDVGEPWVWARAANPVSLVIQSPLTTGSVNVLNGSTSASFSSAPASSQAGNLLKVDGEEDYFRIATHTAAATAFTLDAAYTGTTNTSAAYKVIKLTYQLGTDVLRLVEPIRVYRQNASWDENQGVIEIIHPNKLRRNYPLLRLTSGIPSAAATTLDANGTMSITFNRYPFENIKLDLDYIPEPLDLVDSDTSVPLVPLEHRQCLEFGATHFLLTDKNDNKALGYFQKTQLALQALLAAERRDSGNTDGDSGKILPRQDNILSRERTLRTDSGLIIG